MNALINRLSQSRTLFFWSVVLFIGKDLPVYAVTADVETQKTFKASGFTGILLKPVTVEQLKGVIR